MGNKEIYHEPISQQMRYYIDLIDSEPRECGTHDSEVKYEEYKIESS